MPIAAVLLAADLLVVCVSVLLRFLFNAPVEWADDVARGLMVGSSFFGAASALARAENLGVAFFIDMLPPGTAPRRRFHGRAAGDGHLQLCRVQRDEDGLADHGTNLRLRPAARMDVLSDGRRRAVHDGVRAGDLLRAADPRHRRRHRLAAAWSPALYLAWDFLSPDTVPSSGTLMLVGFFITLFGGLPIGFALALAALIFIWVEGTLPGVIFAQQMARGIDNFVLLAIPFFILVGYLMEANGMSVRLIELLQRAVGRMRGGLNVVMVMSMVLFSGISGSKMADVAAVGSVLIPAARRSKQNPGGAVALLAASAVMAEAIPPCINLIILGFVANLSIGGLFVAGLLPAGADGGWP